MLSITSYLWSECDTNTSCHFNWNIYFSCFPLVWYLLERSVRTKPAKCHANKIRFHVCLLCYSPSNWPWIWNWDCSTCKRWWPVIFISSAQHTASVLSPCSVLSCSDKDKAWRRFLEHWIRCRVYQFSSIFHQFHFHRQSILRFHGNALIPDSFEELLYFNTCEI